MALDLFQTLNDTAPQTAFTNLGDLKSEFDFDTTQSCAETGCGGPGDPW